MPVADARLRPAALTDEPEVEHAAVEIDAGHRHADAVAECLDAMKEFPQPETVRTVRYALANAYSNKGDHAKSEEQLRLILETDPNAPLANNNLGYQLAERNVKLDEAEKLVRQRLKVPWRVYRPSVVVGNSKTGEMDKIDGPYYFFKAIQKTRHALPEWFGAGSRTPQGPSPDPACGGATLSPQAGRGARPVGRYGNIVQSRSVNNAPSDIHDSRMSFVIPPVG
jgi:hypothetical protein